jgi:hypothetical protein
MFCIASLAGFELITEVLVNQAPKNRVGAIEFLFVSPIRWSKHPKTRRHRLWKLRVPRPTATERRECLPVALRQRFVAPITG